MTLGAIAWLTLLSAYCLPPGLSIYLARSRCQITEHGRARRQCSYLDDSSASHQQGAVCIDIFAWALAQWIGVLRAKHSGQHARVLSTYRAGSALEKHEGHRGCRQAHSHLEDEMLTVFPAAFPENWPRAAMLAE